MSTIPSNLLRAAAMAFLIGLAARGAQAGVDAPAMERADALQVLADLTLIDGACRDITVNFGTGFRFASGQGVTAVAVLPGGAQRTAFERALGERRASFGHDELCGEIADNYAEALPGSVTRTFRRGDRP